MVIESKRINEFEDRMIHIIERNTEDVINRFLDGDSRGAELGMERALKYEKMLELCRKLKNSYHRK